MWLTRLILKYDSIFRSERVALRFYKVSQKLNSASFSSAGILESRAIFLPAVSIVAFAFALALELVPAANKVSLDLLQMPALSVFVFTEP